MYKIFLIFAVFISLGANAQEGRFSQIEETLKEISRKIDEQDSFIHGNRREAQQALRGQAFDIGELKRQVDLQAKTIEEQRRQITELRRHIEILRAEAAAAPKPSEAPVAAAVRPAAPTAQIAAAANTRAAGAADAVATVTATRPTILPMAEGLLVVEHNPLSDALAAFDKEDYRAAAIMFADNIKESRGDFYRNLLYLGKSFEHMNKTEEACQSFTAIVTAAERVDSDIKNEAASRANILECDG